MGNLTPFCFGRLTPIKLFNISYPKKPINKSVLLPFDLFFPILLIKLLVFFFVKTIFLENLYKGQNLYLLYRLQKVFYSYLILLDNSL